MSSTGQSPAAEAIAVIGLAGRFPGAADIDAFWDNQLGMRDGARPIPRERLRAAGRSPQDLERPDLVAREAALDDVDAFDAGFFRFTPAEAVLLDPQLRHMHEVAWHVLENAGCDPLTTVDRIGVFASANLSTYWLHNLAGAYRSVDPSELIQIVTSNGQDYPATTLAYRLSLEGPALNIHTACSSGLVAVTVACQSLLDGSCDAALALAASIAFPQGAGYIATPESIHSPDGVCRPFEADARGTIPGDGVAGVMLKRLADAEAAGDRIVGVIKGWAVNNDGRRKMGYLAPSADGQRAVLAEAAAVADIAAGDLDYIEAHGTGTIVGDPIEVSAIAAAHGRPDRAVGLSSVKSSIGHLATAAGMAGLIRALLAVRQGAMPPTLHFRSLNPRIDLAGTGLFVVDRPTPFPDRGRPRRAGVSSFGFGGTNAHVIVESHAAAEGDPRPAGDGAGDEPEILALSAPDAEGLERVRLQMIDWLDRAVPSVTQAAFPALAEIADSALFDRALHPWRLGVSGRTSDEVARALERREKPGRAGPAPENPAVCFVFTGGGVPGSSLASELADRYSAFADALNEIDDGLVRAGLDPIRPWLFAADKDERDLERSLVAAFAFGFAHARLWRSLGVAPAMVLGHSLGEVTAACDAGAISPADAALFVAERAKILQTQGEPGEIIAIAESVDDAARRIADRPGLAISGDSGVGQALASGAGEAIRALKAELDAARTPNSILQVGRPVHSAHMAGTYAPMLRAAQDRFAAPAIPVASTVTGGLETGAVTQAEHWAGQMQSPVLFTRAIDSALAGGCTAFVELGPKPTLAVGGRRTLIDHGAAARWIVALDGPAHERETVADRLARARAALFEAGVATAAPNRDRAARAILPGYPFARTRYWREDRVEASARDGRIELVEGAAPPSVPSEDEDPLVAFLGKVWRAELGLPHVDASDGFLALGGTSLAALKVINALERRLGVRPPVIALIESESLAAFADRVAALLTDEGESPAEPETVTPAASESRP